MWKNRLLKCVAIIAMTAVVNLTMGCNSDNKTPIDSTATEYTETDNVELGSAEEFMLVQEFIEHGWRDAIIGTDEFVEAGDSPLIATLQMSRIQDIADGFLSQGYQFSGQNSFVQCDFAVSADGSDSVYAERITLAFVYAADTTEKAAYIDIVDCQYGRIISPYELSFVEPIHQEQWTHVADGVWQQGHPVLISTSPWQSVREANVAVVDAEINDYLDCVGETAAAGCATALVVCGFSGPGYPKCVALGCGAALVYGLISCAFKL